MDAQGCTEPSGDGPDWTRLLGQAVCPRGHLTSWDWGPELYFPGHVLRGVPHFLASASHKLREMETL